MRKKGTPLLRDMAMQMEPITIMVRLKSAKTAAARFRSVNESRGGTAGKGVEGGKAVKKIYSKKSAAMKAEMLQSTEWKVLIFVDR